jgi:hypothetical protein
MTRRYKMKYSVSLAVLWATEVEADTPEEAADLAIAECPYTLESSIPPHVWDEETGESWDLE